MSAGHDMAFSDLLRRHRQAAGLTQEELAAAAGLSARGVSDLERGLRTTPHKDTLHLLADALRLTGAERTAFAAAAKHGAGVHATAATAVTPAALPGGSTRTAALPLVGRASELGRIEALLASNGPPVLLLAGEPGIGKTRLLQEGMRLAADTGWQVVTGGCTQRSGQEPYAPLLGALARTLAQRSMARQREDLRGCAWLVRLLPELVESALVPAPTWTLPPEQERRLMFAAVGRFLANVAGPAGTLLVLDDLQWAETDALDLLSSVIHAAEVPLRVIGAYRSTEVRDALAALAADLARDGLASALTLGPLAADAATALLDALWTHGALASDDNDAPVDDMRGALRARVLQRAGGVPFFLVSCARAVLVSNPHDAGDGGAIPWDVAQTIRQRVAALPQTARDVLGVAAIAGRMVTGKLLAATTDLAEGDLVSALEACCQARLLIEGGDDAYQFAHDLIREVVEAVLSAARRKLLHQRVGDALEAEAQAEPGAAESLAEQLAYHYGRAGMMEKAIRYLEQAGDRAWASHANAEAERHYRELVARLDGLGRALDAAARARENLGRVLVVVARYDAALEVLEEAVAAYRAAGDIEGQRRVTAQIGDAYFSRGSHVQGVARIEPVIESLLGSVGESAASPGASALCTALARLYWEVGRADDHRRMAEWAVALARAAHDDRLFVWAEAERAVALYDFGHKEEAHQIWQRLVPLAETLGELPALWLSLHMIAHSLWERGEFEEESHCLRKELEVAEAMGDPTYICVSVCDAGVRAFQAGDWVLTRRHYEHAAHIASEIGHTWTASMPLALLGQLSLAEGQREIGSRQLEAALALDERDHVVEILLGDHGWLAERDLVEGQPHAALARLAPLAGMLPTKIGHLSWIGAILAWSYVELGDEARASALIEQILALTRSRCPDRLECLRVAGMLAIRQRRWRAATADLEDAMALAGAIPYPYPETKALYVYGQLHAAMGEPERARERYAAALAICDRLGEGMYRPHIARALAELG